MKVVFIGLCGHSMQAYKLLGSRPQITLSGVASGSEHENMTASFDPAIPYFASWRTMLDEVRPELAVVSPVFGLTGSVTLECARRGIDVFCEKPVAATLPELERVENAVRSFGIRFCAMHYLRTAPAFWQGAKMVRNGSVVTAQKSYRFGTRPDWYCDRELFTSIIPWIGIHAIDWIYAFCGKKFLSVDAECFGFPERAALCRFSMEDGVMSSVSLDHFRPETAPTHDDDRIRCVGTEGILEVRNGVIELLNGNGVQTVKPESAPDLLASFLDGDPVVTSEEIFYLTHVALLAREAADLRRTITIEAKTV